MKHVALSITSFVLGATLVAQGPTRVTDQAFWRLVTSLSEQTGEFPIGNLVTNERDYPDNAARIIRTGGAYIGVGPEQNFSFIASLKPEIAFIVDLRRGNRTLHLLYKAIFERAPDRAAFNALLFPESEAAYESNLAALTNHLTETRGFDLSGPERRELAETYRRFFDWGPNIRYTAAVNGLGQPVMGGGASNAPSFAELMALTDGGGVSRTFLASEESYRIVRQLHLDNRIVPLVANFVGGNALRGISSYLTSNGMVVSVFYGSNVQDYLMPEQRRTYCSNLNALPHDDQTVFLSYPVRRGSTLSGYAASCPGSN